MSELNGGGDGGQNNNQGGNQDPNAGGGNGSGGGAGGNGAGGGDFKWPENWKDHLPEDVKTSAKSFEKFKTPGDVLKSYIHLEKQIGQNRVTIPDFKYAKPEEIKEFFQKVGVPAELKDYNLKQLEGIAPEFADAFKAKAHELNMLPNQAEALLEWYLGSEKDTLEKTQAAQQAETQKRLDEYKQSQGAAYDAHKAFAQKVIDEIAGDGLKAKVASFGSDPDFIDFLGNIGRAMYSEADIKGGGDNRNVGALTPAQATERWQSIDRDKNHAYWNAKHPEHAKAQAEVQNLFNLMHP